MFTLKKYLKNNNITQKDFAELLGVDKMTLWRYVQGTRIPKPKIMQKIFELTKGEVTANDFYGVTA